jgi:LemA protein
MVVLIVVIVVILLIILSQYNKLVRQKNSVKQAQSGIDVYLNQRFDLIPNLVECVKGYAKHEAEVLEKITQLRAEYSRSKDIKEAEKLNNGINQVIAVAEQYPELKASEQFLNLQKSLSKMESQLQAARRIYNNEVTAYNTTINTVPTNIIAKMFNFKEAELFTVEDYKKENIQVDLG